MRITYIIIILLTIHTFSGLAQEVSGKVIDAETGEALIAATVTSPDNKLYELTDIVGKFRLDISTYKTLLVQYVGYEDYKIILDSQNITSEILIKLEPESTLLEVATISSSRYEKRLAEATVSIDVVTPELIANANGQSLDETIDKVPGVQMIDGQVNIRGGSGYSYGAGSRVLLLIDDMPALQGDAGRPNWNDLPVENIAQVEVIKGPASVLYGSAALNGIINVRTGYAVSEPVTKVSVAYRQFMSPQDEEKQWWSDSPYALSTSILHKRKTKKLDLVFSTMLSSTNSFYEDSFNDRGRLSAKLRYRLSDRTSLTLNTMYNRAKSADFFIWNNGGPGAYQPFLGSRSEQNIRRYFIDPGLTHFDKRGNKHKLLSRYYYIENNNNNNQSNGSDNYYLEYQFSKNYKQKNMSVTAGATYYHIVSESELFGDSLISSTNYSAYLQLEKKFFDKMTISVGARSENYVLKSPEEFMGISVPDGLNKESNTVARAGLNYELGSASFLRASFGQGFRFPTITEKFIATNFSGLTIFPNPELQSETGWTAELGFKQGIRISGYEAFVDVSTFWSQYQDMAEFTFATVNGVSGFQSVNVGDTDIKGFEIDLGARSTFYSIPINLMGGYTYINPTYKDFNDEIRRSSSEDINILKYRTKHNFKMDAEAFLHDFSVGLAYNYTSHMVAIDGLLENIGFIKQYRSNNNNGYNKIDLRFAYRYKFAKGSIIINNILNEEYVLRPGLLAAPRNISLRMDFDL